MKSKDSFYFIKDNKLELLVKGCKYFIFDCLKITNLEGFIKANTALVDITLEGLNSF